jgi:hypothetical protein
MNDINENPWNTLELVKLMYGCGLGCEKRKENDNCLSFIALEPEVLYQRYH